MEWQGAFKARNEYLSDIPAQERHTFAPVGGIITNHGGKGRTATLISRCEYSDEEVSLRLDGVDFTYYPAATIVTHGRGVVTTGYGWRGNDPYGYCDRFDIDYYICVES
jgi:hypothetical protein